MPGSLANCADPIVITIAIVMYCVEFFADKIPYLDTVWDLAHTFIRIPAGAVLAYSAVGDVNPPTQLAALLLGGGVALTSHGTKAATRVLINTSPEPFSNLAVSTTEDGIVFALMALVAFHPIVAGLVVLVVLAATIYFLPKILRLLAKGFRKVKRMFGGRGEAEPAMVEYVDVVEVVAEVKTRDQRQK